MRPTPTPRRHDRRHRGPAARSRRPAHQPDAARRAHRRHRRRVLRRGARRGAGARRRERLGQERDGAVDPAPAAARAEDHGRTPPLPARGRRRAAGPRGPRGRRRRDAPHPRQPRRHGLPGADELVLAAPHDRQPDRRRAAPAPRPRRRSHAQGGRRTAGQGRHRRAGARDRPIPARVLRRHAPARDDRQGARLRSRAAHRGRADHRARRHDPGADPRPHAPPAPRDRHGDHLHHPRPRRRGADGRPRGDHVRGQDRRDRLRARHLQAPGASLHAQPAARGASARPPAALARPPPDPGRGAEPLCPADRLHLPPALRGRARRRLRTRRADAARGGGRAFGQLPPRRRRVVVTTPVLQVEDLRVHFPIRRGSTFGRTTGVVRAVDGVSLDVRRGETLGLVGESGSGKTTLGRAVLRIVEPTGGRVRIRLDGEEIDMARLDRAGLRRAWRHMQLIFQDPYASLNPRMTVREIIGESLLVHGLARGDALEARVADIAARCGLDREHLGRYPHAFSGGQRQRISIARALVMRPEFIVCDEPISALDVSIQAQILTLLKSLQQELGLTYLFIAHDLAAVAYACDRVAVMYLGQIVEIAPTGALYYAPRHPYTEALMSAIPVPDPDAELRPIALDGERPDPASPPAGCRFHTRCRYADARCRRDVPALAAVAPGHLAACHHAASLTLVGARDHAEADVPGLGAAPPLAPRPSPEPP
ncbi:MAG: ATP-binding cassette domain-containing protein [Alphaproteobacteria bacterium]|nr:ATP-binding cassette domain-containing protein [Alphaproteobacteria bacterium]